MRPAAIEHGGFGVGVANGDLASLAECDPSHFLPPLKRRGKRQAAPVSKGTRATHPKRPGRKPGKGPFAYREVAPPEAITEPPVDVLVTRDACPACGGPLVEERIDLAYRTELPERPRPQVTQYRVQVCQRLSGNSVFEKCPLRISISYKR